MMLHKLAVTTLFVFTFFANTALAQVKTLSIKTIASIDDVEEVVTSGSVSSSSSSLQLADNTQLVGIRFAGVTLPVGATVSKAYIQFATRYNNATNGTVNIVAQKGNAPAFITTTKNLSNRIFTASKISWTTQPWTVTNERTAKQRTPDLSPIVIEAMASGWSNAGALVFKITADVLGEATACSYGGSSTTNPELIVEYFEKPIERAALTNVVLNEAAGSGTNAISNDWVEIFNNNTSAVSLDSVFITDNKSKPEKFMFKNTALSAKSFLSVEADGNLTVPTTTQAAFSISGSGETIYMFQKFKGVLRLLDSLIVPASQFNTSIARVPDASDNKIVVNTPTFAGSNNAAKLLLSLQFSQPRGLYNAAFPLTLTAPAGATIRYTTNSTIPTGTTGTIYTAPIQISQNTVVKAIAVSALGESKVVTNTYIINSNAAYKELPMVILSTTNSTSTTSEGGCAFEYINKYGETGSNFVDAGFRVFGNASVGLSKKNFRLNFRSEYGYKKFQHPIFEKRPEENYEPVTEFNSLDLKSGFDATNDYGLGGTLLSDYIAHGYTRQMGNVNVHVRFVHVFLNGAYNGVYALREQFSASYMESYFGGDKTKYDNIDGTSVISSWTGSPSITDGTSTQLNDLKKYATTNFQEIKKRLNVKQFIDFMMLFFIGDYEWEYRAAAEHGYANAKWTFHHNDFDGFIRASPYAGLSSYGGKLGTSGGKGPLDLFTLAGFGGSNLEYKTLVKDRTRIIFDENSPNGALSVNNMRKKTEEARTQFRKFNSLEYSRWSYTNSSQFEQRVNDYVAYLPTRVQTVKNFLNQKGLLHTLAPLTTSKPAGKISVTDQVLLNNSNTGAIVYYTINGEDVVFDNGVATTAKTYTNGQALPLKEGKNIVKARPYTNGNFGPLTEVTYIVSPAVNITGVNYKALGTNGSEDEKLEFLLVTNYGTSARTVDGDSIAAAINFAFPAGTILGAGETVMVAKSIAQYPNVTLRKFGWASGKLSNNGEKVLYKTATGDIINEFTYLPTDPWATTANGGGYYLKLKAIHLDNSIATNWEAALLTGINTLAARSSVAITITAHAQKEGDKAVITWVPSHKNDDDTFKIEKWNEANHKFEPIRTYISANASTHYFQYIDASPSTKTDNLYRIALYQGTNTPQYSEILRLDFSYLVNYLVYPNPAYNYIAIEANEKINAETTTIRIIDLYGQVILQEKALQSSSVILVNIEHLQEGQYIVLIEAKGQSVVAKKLSVVR